MVDGFDYEAYEARVREIEAAFQENGAGFVTLSEKIAALREGLGKLKEMKEVLMALRREASELRELF